MRAVNFQAFNTPNMRMRVLSSLVLAPIVLLAVHFGGWVYAALIAIIVGLALREWLRLATGDVVWLLVGIPYLGGFGLAMMVLRGLPVGASLIYYLLAVVWGTDIGAYIVGRVVGGPKLAPQISPNKTWAGAVGGLVFAGVLGFAAAAWFNPRHIALVFAVSLVLSVISQLGDLFESNFKRLSGVKESGDLIPGHGGILDRVDGLIFAAVVFGLFEMVIGARINWW